jgi:hypothetical protein
VDDDDLAPVVPIRSDEDELVLLESAVLDQLEEEDERAASQALDEPDNLEWLARHHHTRGRPRPPGA